MGKSLGLDHCLTLLSFGVLLVIQVYFQKLTEQHSHQDATNSGMDDRTLLSIVCSMLVRQLSVCGVNQDDMCVRVTNYI